MPKRVPPTSARNWEFGLDESTVWFVYGLFFLKNRVGSEMVHGWKTDPNDFDQTCSYLFFGAVWSVRTSFIEMCSAKKKLSGFENYHFLFIYDFSMKIFENPIFEIFWISMTIWSWERVDCCVATILEGTLAVWVGWKYILVCLLVVFSQKSRGEWDGAWMKKRPIRFRSNLLLLVLWCCMKRQNKFHRFL